MSRIGYNQVRPLAADAPCQVSFSSGAKEPSAENASLRLKPCFRRTSGSRDRWIRLRRKALRRSDVPHQLAAGAGGERAHHNQPPRDEQRLGNVETFR